MNGTNPNYSPRRAGEVVGVEVTPGDPRPVAVTCHDHAHTYEIAWAETESGPVVTDLRVTSHGGEPITSATLRRINPDRLARAAAAHDTAEGSALARELREAVDAASGTTEGHNWIDGYRFTEGTVAALAKHAPSGVTQPATRRGGRPRLSREFLARVAQWARDAAADGRSVYAWVADRAAAELGHDVSDETVKGWIRRCKAAEPPLLAADELRKPRRSTNHNHDDRG
nr:hypothetical protein ISGA_5215 [Gordonia sp. NB41Y]